MFQKRMKVYVWNNFHEFHICLRSKCFLYEYPLVCIYHKSTIAFFWIWWFFSWAVFRGFFWNTGFLQVRLQLYKVRQVSIIWSFTFFSPIIFIFRRTAYFRHFMMKLVLFSKFVLSFLSLLDHDFERSDVNYQKEIKNILF